MSDKPFHFSLFFIFTCVRTGFCSLAQFNMDANVYCRSIAGESCWHSLIDEVVTMCFRLSEVVSPVVNSSSPEGHLPVDFQPGFVFSGKVGRSKCRPVY
jgi:hypothetical protein